MSKERGSIEIYHYENFRKYLSDFYDSKKAIDKKFSFRYFARSAGLASPSSLKRVIDGERNLTDEAVEKFAIALGLNKEEKEFFEKLVRFNQTKSSEEKQLLARGLMR